MTTEAAARVGILLALAACSFSACASPRGARAAVPISDGRQVQLKVPFFPNDSDQCGPSSLASVLGYWGKPEAPENLRREIYREPLKGSLTLDMMLAAEVRGMSAEMKNEDLAGVKRELDAGRPVIAFVNVGFSFYPIGHYLVITGYDEQRQCIYAHSGMKRDQAIAYRKFDKEWQGTERWTLLMKPAPSR